MKYIGTFTNADRASKTIMASLSAREVETVEALRDSKGDAKADDAALEFALRAAYREVPRGFELSSPLQKVSPAAVPRALN